MSVCPGLGQRGPLGVADALRQVDCMSAELTARGFGHLFGAGGALLPALTILLTLYVGLLAAGLLTGRSTLGLSTFTPRMLGLGLVLTFATSWVAYQSVLWTLLTGAPDQIAGIVLGTPGSATMLFAARLDALFAVVARAALQAGAGGAGTEASLFSTANLLGAAGLMLLLGTVGVLIAARLALAAMLALGPVFLVLALFSGTRGLFDGWLRATVMFAIVPLFAVLIGGGGLVLIAPLIAELGRAPQGPATGAAAIVFLAAAVHLALMVTAIGAARHLTAGWRPSRMGAGAPLPELTVRPSASATPASAVRQTATAIETVIVEGGGTDRVRQIVGGAFRGDYHRPGGLIDAAGPMRRLADSAAPPFLSPGLRPHARSQVREIIAGAHGPRGATSPGGSGSFEASALLNRKATS